MNRKLLVFLIAGMFWMPSNAQEVPKDQITISPNDCITPNLLGMDPTGATSGLRVGSGRRSSVNR